MNHENRCIPVCGLALSSLLAMGCFVDVVEAPRPRQETGSLTVLWTIANRSDPRACARFGRRATDFELLVYRDNVQVAEELARCEDLRLTVDVPPGEYTGYVTLVDENKDAVTSTLPLRDVRIVKDAELTVDVDFPAGSFL
jgi:hypothetical protein